MYRASAQSLCALCICSRQTLLHRVCVLCSLVQYPCFCTGSVCFVHLFKTHVQSFCTGFVGFVHSFKTHIQSFCIQCVCFADSFSTHVHSFCIWCAPLTCSKLMGMASASQLTHSKHTHKASASQLTCSKPVSYTHLTLPTSSYV